MQFESIAPETWVKTPGMKPDSRFAASPHWHKMGGMRAAASANLSGRDQVFAGNLFCFSPGSGEVDLTSFSALPDRSRLGTTPAAAKHGFYSRPPRNALPKKAQRSLASGLGSTRAYTPATM